MEKYIKETWAVMDKHNNIIHDAPAMVYGEWTEKEANSHVEYWEWSWETTGRFCAAKVRITVEKIN